MPESTAEGYPKNDSSMDTASDVPPMDVGIMNGPSDRLREEVEAQAGELRHEEDLYRLLENIDAELADDADPDIELGDDIDPEYRDRVVGGELLTSVNAWASLASYAVARFYAPSSPWPSKRLAGWSKRAMAHLQSIVGKLLPAIQSAIGKLGASGYGVTFNFPWGIGITVNW